MNIKEIKTTANRYADLFATDEAEFYKQHETDILLRTLEEDMLIIQLANLYYACKCGIIDRKTAIEIQKEILNW